VRKNKYSAFHGKPETITEVVQSIRRARLLLVGGKTELVEFNPHWCCVALHGFSHSQVGSNSAFVKNPFKVGDKILTKVRGAEVEGVALGFVISFRKSN